MTKQTLSEELAELERTDPKVAAAAASFEATKERILEGRTTHPVPCTDPECRWHKP